MHSHSSECDEETALVVLLDAFGSSFSLEEIASAYCRGRRNVQAAGEILSGLQDSSCNSVNHASNSGLSGAKTQKLEPEDSSEMLTHLQKNCNRSKPRKISASMGTVSSILGKDYIRPTSSSSKFKANKQLKLELKEEPQKDELGVDVAALDCVAQIEPLNNREIEEFLFSMLGDGFLLGMDVIRDVLGSCGYDAKESMDKLLDLSTKAAGKREDELGDSTQEFISKRIGVGSQLQSTEFAQSNGMASLGMASEKHDLPRKVLESLCNFPERSGEIAKEQHLVMAVKRTKAFGTVVTEPPDIVAEPSANIVEPQQDSEYAAPEEDKHQVFRTAAKRNWNVMKAYYESAIDEFLKGNHKQANYLREQGKFYNEKAREANEKAAREILEVRDLPVQNEVRLDLHDHHVKEAKRLLKFHLTNLASIHAFQFLKVIVDTNIEDITKGARKRSVMRLLEKESIKWRKEVGNPGTIIIPLDEIDPGRLSFAKSASDFSLNLDS